MSVNYIPFQFPGLANVRCAFQVRAARPDGSYSDACDGGNISFSTTDDPNRVTGSRRDMLAALRARGLSAWAELNQVHGDALVFDPESVACEAPPVAEGDGMATSRPGLGLLIKTADCQPILLAHKSGRYVAALHAGWRGNRCDFPGTGVARFCARYGLKACELLAVRGPSLGPGRAEFVNFEREWSDDFRRWFDPQTQTMDLWSLTRHQLRQAGLPERQIFGLDLCTASNDGQFFSYRREKKCGRQASLIWIATAPGATECSGAFGHSATAGKSNDAS